MGGTWRRWTLKKTQVELTIMPTIALTRPSTPTLCTTPCARERPNDDRTGVEAYVAAAGIHFALLVTLLLIETMFRVASVAADEVMRNVRHFTCRRMQCCGKRRWCSAAVRAGPARVVQRKSRGHGAAGIRATCRRCEAWMLVYLLVTCHAFAVRNGGSYKWDRGGLAADRRPMHGNDQQWTRPTPRSGCEVARTPASPAAGTTEKCYWSAAVIRGDHSPLRAARVGEASNPGPTAPTIAAVGLLRRAYDKVRAAVSYPRPGSESLRGAVAPGFDEVVDGSRGGRGTEVDSFRLKVEAVNSTGWRALQRRLLATNAQVILAQETWLTQDAVPAASAWAKRRGWQSIWAAAVSGPNGGASGGVAILVREGIGCHYPPDGSHVIVEGRAVAAIVQAPGHRPMAFASCYLHHGRGPSGENLEILAAVGQRMKALPINYEYIIGGDLNMEPPDVASTGIQEEIDATIMVPSTTRGTFRGPTSSSLIDYFLVSQRVAAAVDNIKVVEAAGIKGHTPILMEFKPRVTTLRALHLRRPPVLEVERVYGPLPPAPDWTSARETAEEALRAARRNDNDIQRYLDDAYKAWADLSEVELADYAGSPPKKWGERGRLPNLVWRTVVPENVPRVEYPYAAAASWLGATAKELRRISETCTGAGVAEERVVDDIDADPAIYQQEGEDVVDADELARARGRKPPSSRETCAKVLGEIITSLDSDMPSCGDGHTAQDLEILRGRVREAAVATRRRLLGGEEGTRGDCTVMPNLTLHRRHEPHDGDGDNDQVAFPRDDDLATLCQDIGEVEKRLTTRMKSEEEKKWRDWISEGIDRGASRAHAYTRLPKAWTPTTARLSDGTVSSSVDDLMNEQRDRYRGLWKPRDRPFRYEWHDQDELPAMEAAHLRMTADSFAARTSATYDGFHPRQLGKLSDASLDTLGIVLAAVERSGVWPRQVSLIVATLIPKPAGGFRPIGLAPAVYRLWSKARRTIADEWEQRHRRPFFAACSGNGPADTLWRMAARQEAGVASGEVAAAITEDLQSFFENVDRDRLLAEAAALGFPTPIVRAALAAYSSARMLSMGGRMCREMYPTIGVVAGCSLAMVLTKIYCLRALEDFVSKAPPGVKLDTYVDDFTLSMVGKPQAVAEDMADAHSLLKDVVAGTLKCCFAPGKTAIAATTRQLAAVLARKIGVSGGVAGIASLLGIDNAAAAPRAALRASSKRAKRLKAALARKKRLRQVQRAVGSRARKIFVAGIRPAAAYGAEVWGLDDGEVAKLRRLAAASLRPQARGRSLLLTTLWHGVPTAAAENAPLLQFSRMIWHATTRRQDAADRGSSIADIRRMWEEASSQFMPIIDEYTGRAEQLEGEDVPIAFTRKLWRRIRGPMGAVALTAARIGWTFSGPFTIKDHLGAEMLLTNSTPAMVSKRATEALRARIERKIARRWANDEPQYSGRRACLDLVVSVVNNAKMMTPHLKGIMRSVTCGAVMTGDRAIKGGYKVDGKCPLCQQALDTVAHRVYECPCTASAVSAVVPDWFLAEARRSASTCRFWTTGACPDPGDLAPPPPVGLDVKVKRLTQPPHDDESDLIAVSERIYIDGSSTTPAFKSLARAASAVVQTTRDGTPVKVLQAAVPRHLPQTAQAAEFLCLGIAFRALRAKTDVIGDCLNVVKAANSVGRDPFAASKIYAGILLDTHADPGRRRLAGEVRWTRAHQKVVGNESDEALRDIRGNDSADQEAKEALGEHPPLGVLAESQALYYEKRIAHVVKAVTTALALFPRASGRMTREDRPRDARQARDRRRHFWEYRGGAWRCALCHDWMAGDKIPRARVRQRCRGTTLADDARAIARRGHRVCKTTAEMPFVYCSKCGAWGHRRSLRLSAACGPPAASGLQALARIRRGQHPLQRRGPMGVLQPRERVRTTAVFNAEEGGWRSVGDEKAPMVATPIEEQDIPIQPAQLQSAEPATMTDEPVDFAMPQSEDEDVFGHGGSLDNDRRDGDDDEEARGGRLSATHDAEMPAIAIPAANAEAGPRDDVRNRSTRRHARSIWDSSGNLATEATLQRTMTSSRPAATDGAARLDDVRRRVRLRIQRQAEEARSSLACGTAEGREGEVIGSGRPPVDGQDGQSGNEADGRDERSVRRRVEPAPLEEAALADAAAHLDLRAVMVSRRSCEDVQAERRVKPRICATEDSVLASSVEHIYVGTAREGPGDPSPPCSTDTATWPTSAANVADTVAVGDVAAVLQRWTTARAAQVARGEAACGPPHGSAAPWEDTMGTTGMRLGRVERLTSQGKPQAASGGRPLGRREQNSPSTTPARLGTGPSEGRADYSDDGGRPATREYARRRDGGTEPAAGASAARGSGDAAVPGRRDEMPLKGVRRRAQGARNRECPVQTVVRTKVDDAAATASRRTPMDPATLSAVAVAGAAEEAVEGHLWNVDSVNTTTAKGARDDCRGRGGDDGREHVQVDDTRRFSREGGRSSGAGHLENDSVHEVFPVCAASHGTSGGQRDAVVFGSSASCAVEPSALGAISDAAAAKEDGPMHFSPTPTSQQHRRRVRHGRDEGDPPQRDGPIGNSESDDEMEMSGSYDSLGNPSRPITSPYPPDPRAAAARDLRAAGRPRAPGDPQGRAWRGSGGRWRPHLEQRGLVQGAHLPPHGGPSGKLGIVTGSGPGSDVSLVLCVDSSGQRMGDVAAVNRSSDARDHQCAEGDHRPDAHDARLRSRGDSWDEVGEERQGAATSRNGGASSQRAVVDPRPGAHDDPLRMRGEGTIGADQSGGDAPSGISQQIGAKRRRLRGKQNALGALAGNSVHDEFSGGPSRSTTSTLQCCARNDRDGPLLSGSVAATGSGVGRRAAQCGDADTERRRGRGRPPEDDGPSVASG